jgi:hypothetical protein
MHSHLRKSKSAQGGPNTGVLVGLIGLLIIIYILFLPPEVRQELLTENTTDSNTSSEEHYDPLLTEHPGKLEPSSIYSQYSDGHQIPDAYLKVTRNAAVLKSINPFYVSTSIFGSTSKTVIFDLANADKTDNVFLSFAASKRTGRLVITLNGEEIFNSAVDSYNPEPVELPKELLANKNTIEFSASGPGIAFWQKNSYNLLDIKITGYVTDISMQSSKSAFDISDFERANAEKERLSFYVECASETKGRIKVDINEKNVADFVPECSSNMRFDLAPSYFVSGENSIVFTADSGRYSVQLIKIIPSFREMQYPTYYFDIKSEEFDKLGAGTLKARMVIRFADTSRKEFNFRVNNIVKRIDTKDFEYTYEFPKADLLEGNNALKIEPVNTLEISELRVEYFKP